ncbi:MAG: cell wall-binding repeat-containing protein [Dethiobacter sp.]|nr:cell wall-binding repeat-containing protein [Dethiobacter sp.]
MIKRKIKKTLSLILVLAMVMTLFAGVTFASTTSVRISGADRIATAIEVSKAGWASAGTVVLATGWNYADALAGAPLASALNAPILLTRANALPAETKAEISRLGATKIIILGGEVAVSAEVAAELSTAGLTVERIAGATRVETSRLIAARTNATSAFVVDGWTSFTEALAVSGWAAKAGIAIIYANDAQGTYTSLPGITSYTLVKGMNYTDIYDLSLKMAANYTNAPGVIFATGKDFPDAFVGAPYAAKLGYPIILTDDASAAVNKWLEDNKASIKGNTVVYGGTVAFAENLLTELKKPLVIVEPLAVASASASNLAEIVVKFNQPLDATKVVVANFTVGGANAAAVALSADKTTVTVTPAAISATNQATYALVVKKAVGIAADYAKSVLAMDTQIPFVTGLTLTGPTTFDITFSEPIKTAGSVMINNGIYGATVAGPVGNKVTVTTAALADGDYTVKIIGYKDYADFTMDTVELTLAYAKDTAALVASISSAKQTEVKVKFSKKIATVLNANHFYHTFSAYNPNTATTTDNITYTLTFNAYPIPEGSFNLVVKANDGGAVPVKITDVWGVDFAANTTLVGSVTADTTPPTVAVKEVVDEQNVRVEYSEAVAGATTSANNVVKKADGTTVPGISVTNVSGNIYNINLGAVMAGGVYTVTISNITDTALAPNAMAATTLSFTITDKTPPAVSSIKYVNTAAGTPEYLYVTFNEAMATSGPGSVLDVNNYRLGTVKPSAVTAFGTNKYRLTFADTTVFNGATFTYGQLADVSGNSMVALSTSVGLVAGDAEAEPVPGDITIKTKSLNTIEIVVNKVIPQILAADIIVDNNAVLETPAMISYTNDGTKTTIVATLKNVSALTGPSAVPTKVTFAAGKLVTDTGIANTPAINVTTITDNVAPSVVVPSPANVNATTGLIALTFNEDVGYKTGTDASLLATDFVITYKGAALVAGVDYTVSASAQGSAGVVTVGIAITKTLVVDENVTVAVSNANYLVDSAGNKANAFSITYKVN